MATNFVNPSNTIDLRLDIQPVTKDPELFRELSKIYAALRQLHAGVDKFLDIPSVQKDEVYTLEYTDRGQSIDTTANVIVPDEASLGYKFPLGTTISIINVGSVGIKIVPASGVTIVLAGTTATGERDVANWGCAAIRKISTDVWVCYGAGVT